MVRKNEKKQLISYENSIKKSNELSMAKLNQGLSLNQIQLFAFAIYRTQQDGKTQFNKVDFEKKFGLGEYRTEEAKSDVPKLSRLQFSIIDLENDVVDYLNVFQRIRYEKGLFTFKWAEDIIPHILNLSEQFNLTDLTIQSKFSSSFSWILYDYLKGLYGCWYKSISKEALMKLFNVEEVKSYKNNTGLFRQKVLDVAIAEINQFTEINVNYEAEKKGRSIVGFRLDWSTGTNIKRATKKQIKELKLIIDAVQEDVLKYVDIDIKVRRQRAIEIIEEMGKLKRYTEESLSITSEFANDLIKKSNDYLQELNALLTVKSKRDLTEKRDTSFYYNWLEEDGDEIISR